MGSGTDYGGLSCGVKGGLKKEDGERERGRGGGRKGGPLEDRVGLVVAERVVSNYATRGSTVRIPPGRNIPPPPTHTPYIVIDVHIGLWRMGAPQWPC